MELSDYHKDINQIELLKHIGREIAGLYPEYLGKPLVRTTTGFAVYNQGNKLVIEIKYYLSAPMLKSMREEKR